MEENLRKSIEAMMATYGPGGRTDILDPSKFKIASFERDVKLFEDAFGKEALADLTNKLGVPRGDAPANISLPAIKPTDVDVNSESIIGLNNYQQYLSEKKTADAFRPTMNTSNVLAPIKTNVNKTTSSIIPGLDTPITAPSFLPSKGVSETGTSMLLDNTPKVAKKFSETKLGGALSGLFKDEGTKFLQKGTEASKSLKATGVGLASSLIRPEQLLRTDKEGLRTEYGVKDVAGRGLQAAKGFGLLALGDPVGGLLEIGQGVVGLFTDAGQVRRDRATEDKMKKDEARKKLQEELLARGQQAAEGNLEDKQAAMERYGMVGEKGMITPTNMDMGMSSFLSDGYKMYLSRNMREEGGVVEGTRPEMLKYAYKNGGMVKGPSHKNGGVKFNVGGEVVELEGGEAVINKKSTKMFRDILSQINQAGGGVKFEKGGMLRY
tara:strand:+ start:5157 stop:6467 length:1311 start_codon:yes stop_codon:yes gene_type:complete